MILGISGRKQSGKSTSANMIYSTYMVSMGLCKSAHIDDGKIKVSDLHNDIAYQGFFDPVTANRNDYVIDKVLQSLDPLVKIYSFADPLKRDVCINLLGLTHEQCYGTDEQKNTLTHLRWENMPGIQAKDRNPSWEIIDLFGLNNYHPKGSMTAREVMEYVGTSIFRKMYEQVWVNRTIEMARSDGSQLAIIPDCRFPNEVEAIKKAGGKVIRLTRDPYSSEAESECALDKENYDWNNFDFVVDNKDMDLALQFTNLQNLLRDI